MNDKPVSLLDLIPFELRVLTLEKFTPFCDVLNYYKAFPEMDVFEGCDTIFWRNVYRNLTDYPLPEGTSYKEACLRWETNVPYFDLLKYYRAYPNTPTFAGSNTTFWRNLYQNLTDFPLPEGRSYKHACLFWEKILRKLTESKRSMITDRHEIGCYMKTLTLYTDLISWFFNPQERSDDETTLCSVLPKLISFYPDVPEFSELKQALDGPM